MKSSVWKTEAGKSQVLAYYRNILESRMPRLEHRILQTSFGPTFVLEGGTASGPPVVMLHGSMGNSAGWLGLLPLLEDDFSLFCIDIPGEPGLSSDRRLALGSPEPQQWLLEVLDGLQLPRAVLVGMSLGGWYVQKFAVQHPERLAAVCLLACGGLAPQKLSFLFRALLLLMMGAWGQKALIRSVFGKASVPSEVVEFQTLVSAYFNPVSEPLSVFSDAELSRLSIPLFYMGGEYDVLLNTRASALRLKRILPAAEVQVLEGYAHVIADRWTDIADFIRRSSPRM